MPTQPPFPTEVYVKVAYETEEGISRVRLNSFAISSGKRVAAAHFDYLIMEMPAITTSGVSVSQDPPDVVARLRSVEPGGAALDEDYKCPRIVV